MSRRTNGQSEPSASPVVRLKEYEVVKKLGRGGMGIVYLVRHRLTKRLEVLKVLRPALVSRPRLRERFLREVQVAARLDHPNIVKTFTAIENGELLGLVMEYVDGSDLETLVQRSGPLTVASAATIIRQAALGLQHATGLGLVHRDIKPSNILVSRSEGRFVAKLSDFGLSKFLDEPVNDGLTVDGRFLGTPDYMAPEQGLDPSRATVAADIYGLGCSLYYALTGRPPYVGANALAVLNAHINAPVPDARVSRHDVPDDLSAAIQRMLQKDPRHRYSAPSDVAAVLEPFATPGAQPVSSQPILSATLSPSEQHSDGTLDVERVALSGRHDSGVEFQSPIRKRTSNRRGRTGTPIWQTLLQIGMPVALVVGMLYLQPWAHLNQSADGILRLKELTPGTVIEIDNSIKVGAETGKSIREIRLSPGLHSLRFLHGEQTIAQRSIEIKSNAEVELSASFTGLANKERSRQRSVPTPSSSNPGADDLAEKPISSSDEIETPDSGSSPDAPFTSDVSLPANDVSNDQNAVPKKPLQPTLRLTSSTWSLELERQLSGLDKSPDGLMILPRDITDLKTELIIATGPQLRAWDAKTGFPQSIFTPFNVDGISVANNQKSVLYFDDSKCEVWVVQKPKPKRWFWTEPNSSVKRVFAMSNDSRFLACCDYNESFIRWDLANKQVAATMSARQPLTAARVESVLLTSRLDNVLTLGSDGSLTCWDTTDGAQLGAVEAQTNAFNFDAVPIGVHINNTTRKAIVVSQDGHVDARKLPTLELVERQKVSDEPIVMSSYSTRLLAIATEASAVALLDGTDLSAVGTIDYPADASVAAITVSVDGKCVAVAFVDGSIYVARIRKTVPAGSTATDQSSDTQPE